MSPDEIGARASECKRGSGRAGRGAYSAGHATLRRAGGPAADLQRAARRLRGDPRRRRRARHRAVGAPARVPAARRRHRPRRGRAAGAAPRVPRGDRLAHPGAAPARRLPALRLHAGVRPAGRARSATSTSPGRSRGAASRPSPATGRSGCRSRPRSGCSPSTATGASSMRPRGIGRSCVNPAPAAAGRAPRESATRSAAANGRPPPWRNGSAARRSAIRSRIASRSPTFRAVKAEPSGASARAPRSTQRAASGTSAVTQTSPGPIRSAIHLSAASAPWSTTTTRASGCRDSAGCRRW